MSSKEDKSKSDTDNSSQPDESSCNHSQLNHTRYSRLNEKKDLANLNDRLASYIDKVRNLETENARLSREVKTSQETITKEITDVKTVYENELSSTRSLLDELSRKKAKLEIDIVRIVEENEELRENLMKKVNECNSLQDKVEIAENRLSEFSNKYNLCHQERIKLFDENRRLEKEKVKLTSTVTKLKENINQEVLNRVGLENTIQTLREEFSFREQMFHKQLTECKQEIEVTEVDGQVYDTHQYERLQEIREQYEIDLENNKREIQNLYEEKLKSLEAQVIMNTNTSSFALEEIKQNQLKLDEANKMLAKAEEERNLANQKARDLMREIERLKSEHINEVAKHNLEVTSLKEEMAGQVRKYTELMDEKVALDMEIAAYGKLLEGEETRLNITPVTNLSGPRFSKRKRVRLEENEVKTTNGFRENTKGDIEFSEIDVKGKFIRLVNNGKKEVSLGRWRIEQNAGGGAGKISFTFHRSVKINPGCSITVWSSDSHQTRKLPEHLVMKHETWLVGDNVLTTLINYSGEEVASVEHFKQTSFTAPSTPEKNLEVNGKSHVDQEKCTIM